MLDFYGLRKLLSKSNLWTNEKEHSAVIKTVEAATSFNLPMNIINEVFPYGWKNYEFNHRKADFCDKIQKNNPFPPLPSQFLQDLSEREMRNFIEQLYIVLQNQFDECVEKLYKINHNDEDFARIRETFTKKFLKAIKIESSIGILSIVWCVISLIIVLVSLDIKYIPFIITPMSIIFLLLLFYGISKNKYFKIDKDKYPRL